MNALRRAYAKATPPVWRPANQAAVDGGLRRNLVPPEARLCRRHGSEQVDALLEAGSPMTGKLDGQDRPVTVDRAARIAISIAAVGTLCATEA